FKPSMKLVDCMFNLYVNNDNDLINFMNSVLQLSAQLKKLAKLAEVINVTNETEIKYLDHNFEEFRMECDKFDKEISKINYKNNFEPNTVDNMETDLDTINQVNEVFCNLREIIQSLMDKQLFPYNASSLIMRIKKVEEMLNSLDD
ncbi:5030_t:CDS:2, partial [Racocetra persica]